MPKSLDRAIAGAARSARQNLTEQRKVVEVSSITGREDTGFVGATAIGGASTLFQVGVHATVDLAVGDYIIIARDPVNAKTYRFVDFFKGGGAGNNAAGVPTPYVYTPGVTAPPGVDLMLTPAAGQEIIFPDGMGWPFENCLSVSSAKTAADYTTLSAAVGAASAGDIIFLDAETHTCDNVTIPAGVTVVGFDRDNTILQTTSQTYVVTLSNGSRLVGLTLKNNQASAAAIYGANGPGAGNSAELLDCDIVVTNSQGSGNPGAYGTIGDGLITLIDCDVTTSVAVAGGYSAPIYANTGAGTKREVFSGKLDGGITGTVWGAYAVGSTDIRLYSPVMVTAGISGSVYGLYYDSSGHLCVAGTRNIGSTTAAQKVGHIYHAAGYDDFPSGDRLGIAARRIWPYGSTFVSHFRTGDAAGAGELAAYSWQAGVFGGAPAYLNYSVSNEFLAFVDLAAPWARHYLARSITNAAASWQNKHIVASMRTGQITFACLRIDAGDDNNFVELYLDGNAYGACWTVRFRGSDNGVPWGPTTSSIIMPAKEFITLYLYCYWDGANYHAYGYMVPEDTLNVNITGFAHQLSGNWATGPPTAGTVGVMSDNATPAAGGNPVVFDAFYTDFT